MNETEIVTLGCRLNTYESEVMRRHAREAGLADAVIVNTCAVTREAERQARQAIRRIKRERPGARILVTGCAAQIDPQQFARMPEVDRVLGNAEKMDSASFAADAAAPRVAVSDIMAAREVPHHLVGGFEGRARAFVQVQQGCDHRCTFCIIPFGRGPSRSLPLAEIAAQVRALVDNGYGEVVLSGVDLTSYGADLPGAPGLGETVRVLLAEVPHLARLRLSSLDPAAIDDVLLGLIAEEDRLMPHIHLSMQAGDDMVLKRMKRRHDRAGALAAAAAIRARRPDAVFGADLIAGFPTEDEAMFANTLALVEEAGLAFLHVFPFSARPGTPAARMPQIDKATAKARAARLRAAGEAVLARTLNAHVGREARILVEEDNSGRSEHYLPVRLTFTAAPGSIARARIARVEDGWLIGEDPARQ